ncbi:MAG: hypothetical protein GY799_17195, partial [Desulfobulbaceae bacterium]|nr:hypothetical protein [Desulfobulbaceae bacterium]
GTENLPRDIAIYLVRRFCCKTLPSVGKEFGITNYSTVSSVVQRVKVRYERDKYLLKEIEIIKKKIEKGQKRRPLSLPIAWASKEARQRIIDQTVENIRAFKSGAPIRSLSHYPPHKGVLN